MLRELRGEAVYNRHGCILIFQQLVWPHVCAYKLTSLSGRSALRVKRVQTHGEPGGSYLEIWGGLQHVASTTVS